MKLKIAYQGVAGAYSNIAAQNVYPESVYVACETFEEAFEKVQSGAADFAMIPVENSTQLLVLKGTKLEDIKIAMSHPQALAQSAEFLKKNHIVPEARIDTAKSCEFVLEYQDKSRAAIASSLAGQIYGLEVLASDIETMDNNTTRFLIMSREKIVPEDDGGVFVTSFIFKARHIPAALYKALGGFATNGINMTKIESYLEGGSFVSAKFYVEVESHPARKAFQNAMEELHFFSENVHILGTYAKVG